MIINHIGWAIFVVYADAVMGKISGQMRNTDFG
jgi:hypothetical protein